MKPGDHVCSQFKKLMWTRAFFVWGDDGTTQCPNDDDQLLPMPTTTTTSFLPAAANELK